MDLTKDHSKSIDIKPDGTIVLYDGAYRLYTRAEARLIRDFLNDHPNLLNEEDEMNAYETAIYEYLLELEEEVKNVSYGSVKEVVYQALIDSLKDVFRHDLRIEAVIACFVDAMENEKLAVGPQRCLVGIDEETEKERKALYHLLLKRLREIQERKGENSWY